MNRTSTYFITGIFTIVGVAITIGAVLLFGAGRVLEVRTVMETYINESVQGLDVGSPVKFRGVQVGNVENINFTRNFYEGGKPYEDRKKYVLVRFEMQPRALGVDGTTELQIAIRKLTQNGLRVRLASANLTGVAYLELDFMEERQLDTLEYDWDPEYPYIPSTESSISRLFTSVEEVFNKLGAIDVTKVIANLESTLKTVEEKVEEIDTKALSDESIQLVRELRQTNAEVQKKLESLELQSMTEEASKTLSALREKIDSLDITGIVESLESTIRDLDDLVSGNRRSLSATLHNFQVFSAGLRELSSQARKSPSSMIFSTPPKRVLPER